MALNQSGELKKRAWLAKQRLKMGYWESTKGETGAFEPRAPRLMQNVPAPDDGLYRKVCAILDRDELTINPIGQLIDDEVYEGLDPAAKQRYILELSDKFRELKERYYREKTGA
ncbi:MAG: hypothetical protein J1G38_03540 [Clostridiales bacterium]|nr:hypothetical protein [Clostridiales bacterium]